MPPFTAVGATKETSPPGVPEEIDVTVAAAVTEAPCVIVMVEVKPFSFSPVVVPLNAPTAVPQAVARFVTFTVPRPVAKSYPGVVVKAGVFVAPLVVTNTPSVPLVVLLQFGEPPAQGTELLPFVTSLKTHPAGGS